ncbi:Bug family tripartite tricarboxylate transporter substrate binding protein [Xenophilus azovorans]|uniref:Bug family tripartite tricarboxylate transporter substrate binding protein n=1 Tax=Xenophilus azovorans TaxID=151755 RepID=UPI0005707D7A|nr:tripartite tricarboxylate transporter substrate-binding protein [Xenophilus azovorans]
MIQRRQVLLAALGLPAAFTATPSALAQVAYPTKPIRLIVMYPPGGPSDTMARSVAEILAGRLRQPVLVENKPGGGGQIAAAAMLQAPADGHALMLGDSAAFAANRFLYKGFAFDTQRDMAPVAPLMAMPMVLWVQHGSSVNSIRDLMALAKTRTVSFASQGPGSAGHLLGEMLKGASGADLNHVLYRGSAPAMVDLLGGQVDCLFDGIGAGLPYLRDQKLKAIATATSSRLALVPEVPTTAEAGFPAVKINIWFGLVTNAGTPAAVVTKLNEEVRLALATPQVANRFKPLGFDFMAMDQAAFDQLIRQETELLGNVVRSRGITAD